MKRLRSHYQSKSWSGISCFRLVGCLGGFSRYKMHVEWPLVQDVPLLIEVVVTDPYTVTTRTWPRCFVLEMDWSDVL